MFTGDDWRSLLMHLLAEEPPTVEGERQVVHRFAEIYAKLTALSHTANTHRERIGEIQRRFGA